MTPEQDETAIIIRRRIEATRNELFDAWLDPDGMKTWMCPGDIVSADVQIDPRVGGKLLIIMRSPHESFEHNGEFTVIERPSKLVIKWTAQATDWQPSLVTIEFREISKDETELVLTHEDIPRSDVREQYRGGWGQIITQMADYIQKIR